MDFAGAYPVSLLWGVAPPLALLSLRNAPDSPAYAKAAGPDAWLVALAAVSAIFVASSAAVDAAGLARHVLPWLLGPSPGVSRAA